MLEMIVTHEKLQADVFLPSRPFDYYYHYYYYGVYHDQRSGTYAVMRGTSRITHWKQR